MCGPYRVKTGHSHEFTGRECVCSDFLGLRGCFVRVERMQLPPSLDILILRNRSMKP